MKQYEKDYMERRLQLNYHGRYPYILDKEIKSSKDEPLQRAFNYTQTPSMASSNNKQPFFSMSWL